MAHVTSSVSLTYPCCSQNFKILVAKGEIHALQSVLISLLSQNNNFKDWAEFSRKEFSHLFKIYLQQLCLF